ncbi:hypothetical protein C8J57DRAFT_1336662 [Mycena rebaudengoi]|nr:hypothetical protein C8J57DRAFT_1336662 [Mycena rebaudengoi]
MPFLLTPTANMVRHKRAVLSDESDDDVVIVDKSDSAFNNTSGVKASTLPPPIGTRSSAKRKSTPLVDPDPVTPRPAGKRVRLKSQSPNSDVEETDKELVDSHFPPDRATNLETTGYQDVRRTRPSTKPVLSDTTRYTTATSTQAPAAQGSGFHSRSALPLPSKPELNEMIRNEMKSSLTSLELDGLAEKSLSRLQTNSMPWTRSLVSATNNLPNGSNNQVNPSLTAPSIFTRIESARSNPFGSDTINPVRSLSGAVYGSSETKPSDSLPDTDAAGKVVPSMPASFGAIFSSRPAPTAPAAPVTDTGNVDSSAGKVFLEDLETYKTNFDPTAECGVFDLDLQDEVLRPLYVGLPPLPAGRWISPTYDPNDTSSPDSVGGRTVFSSWPDSCYNLDASTAWNIMTFVQSGPYINPCRISPALCSTEKAGTGVNARRIVVDGKTAVSLMVGMCTGSYITEPVAGNGPDPRSKRYMLLLQHNQEWERWQSFHCLVFGYELLYAQIEDRAIQLGSILSPMTKVVKAGSSKFRETVKSNMLSPIKPAKIPSTSKQPPKSSYHYNFKPKNNVRYTLAHDEDVPTFDARGVAFDFNNDIDKLAEILPPFDGEIPTGSFVVAGYTASTFLGQVAAQDKKQLMCVGCNLVWAIVCGTPND